MAHWGQKDPKHGNGTYTAVALKKMSFCKTCHFSAIF